MRALLSFAGATLCVPRHPMIDRKDGGNLWVMPPRPVWDRSELEPEELVAWCYLIAASGRAMLEVLPHLSGGVINYWEAGNWALNEAAEPRGPKVGHLHKRVHMHLIGRSPTATDPDWAWGEAPVYPPYERMQEWWSAKENLTVPEQRAVAVKANEILISKYAVDGSAIDILV